MKARGMVILVAFLLAATATAAVFLYVRGVKQEAVNGPETVTVVVSKKDIPAGTNLDNLIAEGQFTTRAIPKDAVVRGAVTGLAQLKGRQTSDAILAGEQLSTERFQGSNNLPGGSLGIPDGYQAVTVPLEISRAAGGGIRTGDHVTIYGTFKGITVEGDTTAAGTPAQQNVTVTVVPDVEILRMDKPQVQRPTDAYQVTMALRPVDAQKVVFAEENGTVWLSLLPPKQDGTRVPPIFVGGVVR